MEKNNNLNLFLDISSFELQFMWDGDKQYS